MVRLGLLSAFVGCLVLGPGARGQVWRYQWKQGQVLTYRVEETIKALEDVEGAKAEAATRINMTKRWEVLAVDQAGVATLRLSLTALRQETSTGDEPLLFDSAKPEQSDPQLREQLMKWIGTPLAVLRVDARGLVIEVKESKQGTGARYESEPPFLLVLPADGAKAPGQSWERSYQVTLEPPQGTGEKYSAAQKYTCKAADARLANIGLVTAIAGMPPAVADRMPLLPLLTEGEVLFDTAAGVMRSARLSVDKELKGHQGEASSYRLIRTYKEELVGN